MTLVQRYTQKLDNYLSRESDLVSSMLARIESATGVSRLHLAIALATSFALYMIFGHFAKLICNAIGFVYPAYASLVALDRPAGEPNPQIEHLLRYWVVYAFVTVADFFSGSLFRIVPFYWLSKMVFLIWCLLPIENNGSTVLYVKAIRPVFLQIQPVVDSYYTQLTSYFVALRND